MRCKACNVALTDYEATRQTAEGVYLDLCNTCYNSIKHDVSCVNNTDTNIIEQGEIFDSIKLYID